MTTKARQLSKILAPGGAIADGSVQASKITGTIAQAVGGTGAQSASGARTALGLAIGSDVQAWHSVLDNLVALAGTSGFLKRSGANSWLLDTNTYLTGNQTITFSGDATGAGATSVALTLANSGVTAGTYGSSTAVPVLVVDAKGRVTSVSTQNISGALTFTGDVTGTGATGSSTALTLANSGVTAGTYTKITTDAKGRVTSGTTLVASDIPNLDASKITSGTIDPARLPSYVDDVLEAANLASFPATGETGKIYVALDTNKTYRWSGSSYVYITSGAVDSVAGKTGVVTLTSSDVGLGLVENKSSATIRGELTSANVTTALGFTPYNSTNPSGYITSSALSSYLSLAGGTLSGKVTFASAVDSRPQLPGGLLGVDTGDANFDIWGISRDYYPSHATAANAWGIRWDGDSNQVRFIGNGTVRLAVDLDGGSTGALTWEGNTVLHAGNYTSYSPSLTGSGASGTWGINISGSANTLDGYDSTEFGSEYWRSVTVNGDANTYYPVVFQNSYQDWSLYLRKQVHDYATWDGTLTAEIEYHSTTWGGDAGYVQLRRLLQNQANKFLANWAQSAGPNSFAIVWLRGGGRTYQWRASRLLSAPSIYYTTTDLGDSNGSVGPTTSLTTTTQITPITTYNASSELVGGNTFLHAGNYSSYALPLTGGNVTGTVGFGTTDYSYTQSDNTAVVGSFTNNRIFVNGSIQLLGNNDAIVFGRGTSTFLKDEELGFGWGGGWYMTDTDWIRTRNSKHIYSASGIIRSDASVRAPIFYDQDDTGYYIDASSSTGSRLSHLYIGNVAGSNDGGWNARLKLIGSSHARLDVVSNSDGIVTTMYSHTGQGVGRVGTTSNHPLALTAQNDSIGGYVYSGSLRSPIFYDSDDTSYYIDPNSTSNSALRMRGGALFGPNVTWGASLYVGTDGRVGTSATVAVTNGNLHLDSQNGYQMYLNWYSTENIYTQANLGIGTSTASYRLHVHGTGLATNDFRAPLFYDSNDTGYYCDPASTSNMSTVTSVNFRMGNALYLGGNNNYINNNGTWFGTNSSFRSDTDIRATIFYDTNDTNYYIDPASTSILNYAYIFRNFVRRENTTHSGISWYSPSYTSWCEYMSPAGQGSSGPTGNITAPSGTLVTSWALRSFIENVANYGWTWESGSSTGQPSVVAEIRSSDGSARFGGSVRTPIYYDSDNTSYYLDPNSTTSLRTVGDWRADASTWTGEFAGKMQYHSSNWYLQFSSNMIFRNSGGSNIMTCDSSGNVTFSGNVTAYSDARLKENIHTIDGALSKVLSLRGVYYNKIGETKRKLGFVAQETQQVLPEVVVSVETVDPNTDTTSELLAVDYGNTVALLVEAIKEQQQTIETQNQRIEKLEKLLQQLI